MYNILSNILVVSLTPRVDEIIWIISADSDIIHQLLIRFWDSISVIYGF